MFKEFAPYFHTRFQEQINFERNILRWGRPSPGGITEGIYAYEPLFAEQHAKPLIETFQDSHGIERVLQNGEVLLAQQIAEQLKIKQPNRPITVLDIGGGAGNTFGKLGLKFEEDVKAGNLALIVSNIKGEPHDYAAPETRSGKFITETADLVHYITGTFDQIGDRTVSLQNGFKMPLRGNVDIVNEQLSLSAWSLIPEWDILEIAPLLSLNGIYIVYGGDFDTDFDFSDYKPSDEFENIEDENAYGPEITMGINIAHQKLQEEFGLQKVTQVEEGNLKGKELSYIMFKKTDAPAVSLSGNLS